MRDVSWLPRAVDRVNEDELAGAAGQVVAIPEAVVGVEPVGRDPALEDKILTLAWPGLTLLQSG